MREALRGYVSATLEPLDDHELAQVSDEVRRFTEAIEASPELREVLVDDEAPLALRSDIVAELLAPAHRGTRAMVGFVVRADFAGELTSDLDWLIERCRAEQERRSAPAPDPDPPAGRSAIDERVEGYALAFFENVDQDHVVDEVQEKLALAEDIVVANPELRMILDDFDIPAEVRVALSHDLLGEQIDGLAQRVLDYVLRQSRGQVAGHLEHVVTWLASERGRRQAIVSSAVPLDASQRELLAESLSRLTGRRVTIRATVDPSLLGGMRIEVGDLVLDTTVRQRLEDVRRALARGASAWGTQRRAS
jgi:F-type H+-transporting ATPase subunit delta